MEYLKTDDFFNLDDNIPIIDVRSPSEFEAGHISGASNIPLFDDEERAVVGISYKQQGKIPAIEKGLDIIGPKMTELAKRAKSMTSNKKIRVYCWRGGMRSEKMAWLFELVGLKAWVLEGGYKAYRNSLLEDFSKIKKLIVLQGPTGSGKTDILHKMIKRGEQVIDLEKRANHKGSAFGSIGLGQQPTTMQFQNDIYNDLIRLDTSKRIWVEGESLSIGKVYLPESLWETMNESAVVEIDLPKEIRAERLTAEYGVHDLEPLAESIRKITRRFGPDRTTKALELLEKNKLYEVALMLLDYYDKGYKYSKEKYKKPALGRVESQTANPETNAKNLVEKADELEL